MLELVAPVVATLRGGDGAIDVRAAMALFLLACVHCALMVMMLKVAGTMVSAWNVFGLASGEADTQSAAASAPAAAPAVAGMAEPAASAAPSRTAMMVRTGRVDSAALRATVWQSAEAWTVTLKHFTASQTLPLGVTARMLRQTS